MEQPQIKMHQGIYDQEELDDEALELIVHPNKLQGA